VLGVNSIQFCQEPASSHFVTANCEIFVIDGSATCNAAYSAFVKYILTVAGPLLAGVTLTTLCRNSFSYS